MKRLAKVYFAGLVACLSLSAGYASLLTPTETATHAHKRLHQPTDTQQPATGNQPVRGKDGGATGAFTYSTNPTLAATQRVVKGVIETYQKGLNTSNTEGILPLFASDAVVEWENKPTVIGRATLAAPYRTLFQSSKFTTVFQYDAVDVYNDIALIRTHHLKGQTEEDLKTGKKKLDFNRELFILKKNGAAWQIIFYSFNTQPRQGEQ